MGDDMKGRRERNAIVNRKRDLEQRIKGLPTAEKLRLAAEFYDKGMVTDFAIPICERALAEMLTRGPK